MKAVQTPLHISRRMQGRAVSPARLSHVTMSVEQIETMESIALDVFAAMSNAGATFAEALAAIYLTGFENALAASKEKNG